MANEQQNGPPLEFGLGADGKPWYHFNGKPISREDFIAVNLGVISANLGALAEFMAAYVSDGDEDDEGEAPAPAPVAAKSSLGDLFGTGTKK